MQKGTHSVKKREIFGWCCFDFANSSFTTIIITVVYSVYFNNVVAQNHPMANSWWGMALAISQLIVITLSPWLGAIADFTARKKIFLMASAIVCSIFTAALYGVGAGMVMWALLIVMIANIAFSFSENFCASFLPEISTPENCGRISGYGWSFGYFGGLASLGVALWMIMGESGTARVAWTFPMTAIFFILASLPTMIFLRERARPKTKPSHVSYWKLGWSEIFRTLKQIPKHRSLAIFFISFTCFMSGLSAIISFAALFADDVLHFTQQETIMLFASLQISGAVGAFAFGFFQDKFGSKNSLISSLVLWLIVSVWVFFCDSKLEFFILGNVAGLGIGSLQSASRAVVAMLTPVEQSGEFFGFWGLFGKLGGVVGPLTMGLMASFLGFRMAGMLNGIYFLIGLIILLGIRFKKHESV